MRPWTISEADDSSVLRLISAPRSSSTPRATLSPSLRTWLDGGIGDPTSTVSSPLVLTNGVTGPCSVLTVSKTGTSVVSNCPRGSR